MRDRTIDPYFLNPTVSGYSSTQANIRTSELVMTRHGLVTSGLAGI